MGKKRSNYRLGRSREYGVLDHCRNIGAIDCTRSYGSHGIIDCRAVFPDKVLLIQVKPKYIGKKEMDRLVEFANKVTARNIHVMLWRYDKKFRSWKINDLTPHNFMVSAFHTMDLHEFKNKYGVFHTLEK